MRNTHFIIVFGVLGLLIGTAGCNLFKKPTKTNTSPAGTTVVNPPPSTINPPALQTVLVGTFDDIRTGGMSFATSPSFSQARSSLLARFPRTRIVTFQSLTTENLDNVKVLILHVLRGQKQQMTPLTPAERQSLINFVANGGSVFIMTDHIDFNDANQSLLAPFNMSSRGVVRDMSVVNVSSPRNNAITNGRFGVVNSFSQNWSSGFSRVPSNALRIAGNQQGDALVIFEPRVISNIAGAVVLFSDVSTFIDDKATGMYSTNEILYLNTLDYLLGAAR